MGVVQLGVVQLGLVQMGVARELLNISVVFIHDCQMDLKQTNISL